MSAVPRYSEWEFDATEYPDGWFDLPDHDLSTDVWGDK